MTCKQLGGPCDFELRGATADEVIKAQDQHLKDAVAGGDNTHEDALRAMKGWWKRPIAGMGGYRKTKRDFAELPETGGRGGADSSIQGDRRPTPGP